ncbi:sigma-70 family RNA polymerase sigma factor [Paenibacillus rhizovicinus]|uniref:Sigma-70 family RNA polymerase sigma factor n=1 Tax=Paenibacillus rhizovicinus TaxID=2704463 RepID=A0A6C0P7D2_9BACL|nr:sigma-70 family RNA polymerase sigma factor [Paenibacillus rhizovicinus]QHW33553.1 sigma-70 family RNA polymerase sigma factor [Paenibacillus rhizovicinus]
MEIARLWEEYGGELTGYLRNRAPNAGDAEDITSEVFLRAWKSEVLLAGMTNKQCRLWLYTTAKRIVIDLARKKRLETRVQPVPERVEDDLSGMAVSQAIGRLPKELQDIFVMRYFSDLDSTQIGQQLGLSPATVRTQLRKARILLRKYWTIN